MDDDRERRWCRDGVSVAFDKTGEGGGTTGVVVDRRLAFVGVSCRVDGVIVAVDETLALTADSDDSNEVAVVVATAVVVVVADTGSESCCWKFSQDVRGV
jgi:hypothetical protein